MRAMTRPPTAGHPGEAKFAARVRGIPGSAIDRSIGLLQGLPRPVISFAMGSPAPQAMPLETIARIAAKVLEEDAAPTLSYAPTEGERTIRAALARFLGERGEHVAAETLLITAGGTQGIDLFCKLFVDRGDQVAVESPTYANGVAIITSYEGEVLRCPTDENGMDVDALAVIAARHRLKAIYAIPNFQNPGGSVLSLARRERLLALAERHDALILEDDPYGLLHFDSEPPASLWAMSGGSGRVVAVHTFSKILSPGLRVGWVRASAQVIDKMIAARQGMDTCASVIGQRIVAEFLDQGLLEPHLETLRRGYALKCKAMDAALQRWFGGDAGFAWTRPAGGFFLWLRLPPSLDADALFPVALDEGVAFIPGSAFEGPGGNRNALRLCFASVEEEEIKEGIRRLSAAVTRLQSSSAHAGEKR